MTDDFKAEQFFERVKLELDDVYEDLAGLPLNMPECRIGDFGCGWGYTTLSLMIALRAAECVGVDKFVGDGISPSLLNVQHRFDKVKHIISTISNDFLDDNLKRNIQWLLNNRRYPIFQENDILVGDKLPSNLDFAYCKKVLSNIFTGEFGNLSNGEGAINIAIANIVGTIRPGGLFCLVEKSNKFFEHFLEKSGLTILRICRIQRKEIKENGRATSSALISQYFVYHCRKL